MMKKLNKIFASMILMLLILHSYAQKTGNKTQQPGRAVIKLKLVNYENMSDTIDIVLNTDPIKFGMSTDKRYKAVKDSSGLFTFDLPVLEGPARIFIQERIFDLSINGTYWVEPKDDVLLRIDGKGKNVLFCAIGEGSAKYKYKQYRDSIFFANVKEVPSRPKTVEFLNQDLFFYDRFCSSQLEILNHFKSAINPLMFKILEAEVVGKYILDKWTTVSAFYRSLAPSDPALINRTLALEKEKPLYNVDSDAVVHSVNYIYGKKNAAIAYNAARYNETKSIIAHTYNYLKEKYSGRLRDYLIAAYLLNRPDGDENELKEALTDATVLVKDEEMLKRLRQFHIALTFDTMSDPYTFSDTCGNNRYLSEWKGKVILIDFWFNGCINCIHYSKNFEEKILPYFKNNNSIVFVGLNTDIDKQKWLNGINSKEYTNVKTINLNTQGKGFQHPFPKMFNVTGAPYLFLIGKDGQLITANLSTTNTNKIVEQIKKALEK